MAALALTEFLELLARLHLLDASQIGTLRSGITPNIDPKALARDLISRGWLTPYQANLLLQGRGEELVLGSYVLLDKLGEGGMGAVFRARNWKLGRVVAIKLIRKERLTGADAVRRFHREIRAAAQLEHANVVRAYDADEVNGTHFFVMEFVEGTDLAKLVTEHGPLPPRLACDYIRQAALGLQHAHEHGLVHRDIKPANLLLAQSTGSGIVKILDMGLARIEDTDSEESGTLTQVGIIMGTPDYMAPEQSISASTVDIRGDLYGLGCCLYFLLTGSVPFPGGSLTEKLVKHQLEEPRPIATLRPDVPAAVSQIVARLMAKNRDERYQTPGELAAALTTLLRTPMEQRIQSVAPAGKIASAANNAFWQEVVAEPIKGLEKSAFKKKPWMLIGSVASVLIVGGIVLGFALSRPVPDKPPSKGTRTPPQHTAKGFALEFDGLGANVVVPDFKFQGDHPLTVEGWVTPAVSARPMAIFSNFDHAGLGLEIMRGSWVFTMHDGVDYCRAWGGEAQHNCRVHVAGIFDQGELRIYLDGKEKGRAKLQGAHRPSPLRFLIGANPERGHVIECFRGIIDEVRISNSARYTADFTPSPRFQPDANTLALYHFDEGDGPIALDATRHESHGTIHRAAWVGEDAKPATTESTPAPPVAVTVDLLSLIDPAQDGVQGTWRSQAGELLCDEMPGARIRIPYHPPQEYDLRINFTRKAGVDAVSQVLVAGGQQVAFTVGGAKNAVAAFTQVDQLGFKDNPTTQRRPAWLNNGQRYELVLKVRRYGVKAILDGEQINRLGTLNNISLPKFWKLQDDTVLGLAAWNSTAIFHGVEVTEISGPGTFDRPEDAAAREAESKRSVAMIPAEALAENAWGRFAPGSWVASKVSSQHKGASANAQVKETLLENAAEKCLVEYRSSALKTPSSVPHKRGAMSILPGEDAQQREAALSKMKGTVRWQGEEKLVIAGKNIQAKVIVLSGEVNGQLLVTKIWLSGDVPGAMCRKTELAGDTDVQIDVTDFGVKGAAGAP